MVSLVTTKQKEFFVLEAKKEKNDFLNKEIFVTVLKESYKKKPSKEEAKIIVKKLQSIKVDSSEDSLISVLQFQDALLAGYPHKCASWAESTDLKHEINHFKSNIMCFDFDEGIKNAQAFELKAADIFMLCSVHLVGANLMQIKRIVPFKYHCYLILDEVITDPIHYDLVYKAYVEHYSKIFEFRVGYIHAFNKVDFFRAGKGNAIESFSTLRLFWMLNLNRMKSLTMCQGSEVKK